jgi:hypothetical protein
MKPHTQALAVDMGIMRPRFGRMTQVLSVVFVLAGVGAGLAGLNSGHQTTPDGQASVPYVVVTG